MFLINHVAQVVGLSQKRIRDYERAGLIRPQRQERTNNRVYSALDIARIQRVTELLHSEGFTLECLRKLLAVAPCWEVFGCPDPQDCAAHQNPHQKCWSLKSSNGDGPSADCLGCPVYLCREGYTGPLLPGGRERRP